MADAPIPRNSPFYNRWHTRKLAFKVDTGKNEFEIVWKPYDAPPCVKFLGRKSPKVTTTISALLLRKFFFINIIEILEIPRFGWEQVSGSSFKFIAKEKRNWV